MELPQRVYSIKNKLDSDDNFRNLLDEERDQLLANGNTHANDDWSNFLVSKDVPKLSAHRIRNCHFEGKLRICQINGMCGKLPAGIYNSCVRDCYVSENCRISNCESVSSTYFGKHVSVLGCGRIGRENEPGEKMCNFGNATQLPIVIETGGRETYIYAEMNLQEASRAISHRHDQVAVETNMKLAIDYSNMVSCDCCIVDDHASILNVPVLLDSFIGQYATIVGSTIENSTILSSKDEPTHVSSGCTLRNSLIQWHCEITSYSIIQNSLIYTCSGAEHHGKLFNSILGPYSKISEGEISCSFVGPLTGFHHQALLISCYWPMGKGNVAYGANVGSNHSGKAPDQEIWSGEGVFFGLGCSIKFPTNLSEAPYSLIAPGVVTMPQRISFPFSLISANHSIGEDRYTNLNSIYPAWVLAHNYYSVLRNELKYYARGGKSKRFQMELRLFRPSLVALMQRARDSLCTLHGKTLYTDADFSGLGKNILSESVRIESIKQYTYFMFYYAVGGLWTRLQQTGVDVQDILHQLKEEPCDYASVTEEFEYDNTGTHPSSNASEWNLQVNIIRKEITAVGPDLKSSNTRDFARNLLVWYSEATQLLIVKAEKDKSRDTVRGKLIIPGYTDVHGDTLATDKLLITARARAESLQRAIQEYLEIFLV